MKKRTKKGAAWLALGFYLLIAFEFFYMASPFAVYFYSIYAPGLSLLNSIPLMSSLSGFFLPHIVESTNSVLLNSLLPIGIVISSVGMIFFLITAGQVYYSKLFRKGVVSKGIYRYVRHPQYLSFAICSFGLLLLWPRYLTLIMFVTMLFVYYLLALVEERECLHKFGKSYEEYLGKTNMFFPFGKFNRRIREISARGILSGIVIYLAVIIISLKTADLLRNYSIESLHKYQNDYITAVSVTELSEIEIERVLQIAERNGFPKNISSSRLIAYILPKDLYISEIPMRIPEGANCHIYSAESDSGIYKICYCRPESADGIIKYGGSNLIKDCLKIHPVEEIWVDINDEKLLNNIRLNDGDKRYRGLIEPIF